MRHAKPTAYDRLAGARWALPHCRKLAIAEQIKADVAHKRVRDCGAEIESCLREIEMESNGRPSR